MVCIQIEELERFVAGTIEGDDHASVSEHLSTCSACRDLLDDVRANIELAQPVRRALAASMRIPANELPDVVGSYRIIREIGRGGTGIVYEAQQSSPARRVALKLLNLWAPDEYGRRLLQREAQALARVRHPCIAAVHDAGTTRDGRSYLVMELIEGRNLLAFARERQLDVRAKLALFMRVCDAVAAAHRRGVIHRDLKPSNILVEADGTPRVLDFGLAKILDRDDPTTPTGQPPMTGEFASIVTDVGRVVGTIPYMSPEQIRGSAAIADLDLSSDVYSLGVVLFELLTGRLPYELDPTNLPEAARIICEVPPIRPRRIAPELRGELETIILKALEKLPERRYAGAAALRDDLERFASGQPIAARAPTLGYQLRKLVARHRLPSALAAVVLLLLIAFAGTLTALALRLADERADALAARDGEKLARQDAERQRNIANAVNDFLVATLGSVDPWRNPGGARDRTTIEALDIAAAQLDAGAFPNQPEIEAAIRHAIGDTYRALGKLEQADSMLRRALKLRRALNPSIDNQAALSLTLNKLARVRHEHGDTEEAEALFREALNLREQIYGPDHEETATILNNLGALLNATGHREEAQQVLGRALDIRRQRLPHPHSDVATTINNLAVLHYARKDFAHAETLLRESLAIDIEARGGDDAAREHPNAVTTLNNIAMTLLRQGRADDAIPLLEDVLDLRRRTLGEHPLTSQSLFNLATALRDAGDLARARPLAEECVAMHRAVFGTSHRQVAASLRLYADLLRELNMDDEAAARSAEADAIEEEMRSAAPAR